MSGSETKKPRIPNALPIRRCMLSRSRGTSSSTIAPSSGVNRIQLRMWLWFTCILSLASLAQHILQRHAGHSQVVAQKEQHAQNDQQRVVRDAPALNHPHRIAED